MQPDRKLIRSPVFRALTGRFKGLEGLRIERLECVQYGLQKALKLPETSAGIFGQFPWDIAIDLEWLHLI